MALFNANAKPSRIAEATVVMNTLIRSSTTSAKEAVIKLPTSSTRPVPIRLRRPSTSVMIRETRLPVLFTS